LFSAVLAIDTDWNGCTWSRREYALVFLLLQC
jgi:hypothetical protein